MTDDRKEDECGDGTVILFVRSVDAIYRDVKKFVEWFSAATCLGLTAMVANRSKVAVMWVFMSSVSNLATMLMAIALVIALMHIVAAMIDGAGLVSTWSRTRFPRRSRVELRRLQFLLRHLFGTTTLTCIVFAIVRLLPLAKIVSAADVYCSEVMLTIPSVGMILLGAHVIRDTSRVHSKETVRRENTAIVDGCEYHPGAEKVSGTFALTRGPRVSIFRSYGKTTPSGRGWICVPRAQPWECADGPVR
ncbi:MAG TPA: hypothetical protein VJ783_20495 [Pirellulales bacterium]|nr:hypothetical protein [Pirellulales bacterium]